MKIAIIGAGFSGLAVARHLLNRSAEFAGLDLSVFDSKGIGGGASGIAAGLLHPFAGAHAKLNARGLEGMAATVELLEEASQALGLPIASEKKGFLRLAIRNEQTEDFKRCAERYPNEVEWLSVDRCQKIAPGCIPAPGLWIKNGLAVYSNLYLKGLWKSCETSGALFKKEKIVDLNALDRFDLTILAAGDGALLFPETRRFSLSRIKGQVLELERTPGIPALSYPLNSQSYLLMNETGQTFLAGATFEREFLSEDPDREIAEKEILPKINELFPPLTDAPILACRAGIRVSAPGHLPIVERLSSKRWIISGMGSKGLLYHALYARELVERIRLTLADSAAH